MQALAARRPWLPTRSPLHVRRGTAASVLIKRIRGRIDFHIDSPGRGRRGGKAGGGEGVFGNYLSRSAQGREAAPVPASGARASCALRQGCAGRQPPLRRGAAVTAPYK